MSEQVSETERVAPLVIKPGNEFTDGTIVEGQVPTFPAWPARCCDPKLEYPGEHVMRSRPRTKKTVLVKWFGDDQYSWMSPSELKILSDKDIEAGTRKKGDAGLRRAYEIALDKEGWQIADLVGRQARLEEKIKELKAKQAGQAYVRPQDTGDATRTFRDDVEQPQSESMDEDDKPATKKRKVTPASAPTSATTPTLKFVHRTIDTSSAPSSRNGTAPSSRNGKKPVTKSRTLKQLSSEAGNAQCAKWRHDLQKAFLGKTSLTELDPVKMDAKFRELESFPFQADWLVSSKLPKILKRISILTEPVPQDDVYRFKWRAGALVEKFKSSFFSPPVLPLPQAANDTQQKQDKQLFENDQEPLTALLPNGPASAKSVPDGFDDLVPEAGDDGSATLQQHNGLMRKLPAEWSDEEPPLSLEEKQNGAAYPSPSPSTSRTSLEPTKTSKTSLVDLLNSRGEHLGDRTIQILNEQGIYDLTDLYLFNPSSWRKFVDRRIKDKIASPALEFCLTEAIDEWLEERHRMLATTPADINAL